jgi:hypothetical protein
MISLADIRSKYEESFEFLQARKRRQVSQLVLLNNLGRGDQNIASTLLITLFNRIMSSLYDDKMQVKFLPSQGILQDQLNSYNILAQSDFLEMAKAKLDYDWTWDALFFGQGFLETLRFNKKRKIMEPSVINPLAFGYDPYFDEVQQWRYYWKWVTKTKWELKKLIKAKVITGIKDTTEIASGVDTYLWDYKVKRDAAKKGTAMATDTHAGDVYQILEFYGYDDKGDKMVWWVDKGFTKELFKQKLDLQDGEQIVAPSGTTIDTGSKWPIVVKQAFREPHSSIQFSVADLLEDKHRAKSVLLNLAYIAAKDKANPLYLYNPDKIKDVTQLFNRQISQHIPVEDVLEAIAPLNKENPMDAGLLNFISILTTEANEPVGTGTVAQPEPRKLSNTATEAAIDQQLNDMAQSLQSKVMQFGESEFWSHWFHRYKKYGEEFGSKMANIVGVKGVKTQEVQMSDFQTDFPPGVLVYSAKEAEYKELILRRDLINLYPQLPQTLGPEGMRNFNKHVFFPKFLQDPSLIDVMFPETLDEMKAIEENEILKENKYPPVSQTDDHLTHIYMHQMVMPKTLATWFHIAEHQEFATNAKNVIMEQEGSLQSQNPSSPNQPINKERLSPMGATAPLKQEMQASTQTQA